MTAGCCKRIVTVVTAVMFAAKFRSGDDFAVTTLLVYSVVASTSTVMWTTCPSVGDSLSRTAFVAFGFRITSIYALMNAFRARPERVQDYAITTLMSRRVVARFITLMYTSFFVDLYH
jgi:hypothetical protein